MRKKTTFITIVGLRYKQIQEKHEKTSFKSKRKLGITNARLKLRKTIKNELIVYNNKTIVTANKGIGHNMSQ